MLHFNDKISSSVLKPLAQGPVYLQQVSQLWLARRGEEEEEEQRKENKRRRRKTEETEGKDHKTK